MHRDPDYDRLMDTIAMHSQQRGVDKALLVEDMIGFLNDQMAIESDLLEGIRQAESGMGRPLDSFLAELAVEYGFKTPTAGV